MSNLKWGFAFSLAALVISVALGIFSGVAPFYIFIRTILFAVIFFGLGTGIRVVINSYFPELLFLDEETEPQITFDQPQPGSQVNITLGASGEYAVPEFYKNSGDQELGNIEDLIAGIFKPRQKRTLFESPDAPSKDQNNYEFQPDESNEPDAMNWSKPAAIDRNEEEDYNVQKGGSENFQFVEFQDSSPAFETAAPAPPKSVFTPVFGDDSGGLGGLPDLDTMATAFSSNFGGEPAPVSPPQSQPYSNSFEEAEPMVYNKGNKAQPLKGDFDPQELAQGIRTVLSKDK